MSAVSRGLRPRLPAYPVGSAAREGFRLGCGQFGAANGRRP